MNKSYDVYMCRERKQVFRVPINNYAPLGDKFGYIPPMQQMFDASLEAEGYRGAFVFVIIIILVVTMFALLY